MADNNATWSTIWAVPLPDQVNKTTSRSPRALFKAKLTGPASSVSTGVTITGISNDLYYIESLETFTPNSLYAPYFSTDAPGYASTALVKIGLLSTGAFTVDATDLSGQVWYVTGIGSGKFSTLLD